MNESFPTAEHKTPSHYPFYLEAKLAYEKYLNQWKDQLLGKKERPEPVIVFQKNRHSVKCQSADEIGINFMWYEDSVMGLNLDLYKDGEIHLLKPDEPFRDHSLPKITYGIFTAPEMPPFITLFQNYSEIQGGISNPPPIVEVIGDIKADQKHAKLTVQESLDLMHCLRNLPVNFDA